MPNIKKMPNNLRKMCALLVFLGAFSKGGHAVFQIDDWPGGAQGAARQIVTGEISNLLKIKALPDDKKTIYGLRIEYTEEALLVYDEEVDRKIYPIVEETFTEFGQAYQPHGPYTPQTFKPGVYDQPKLEDAESTPALVLSAYRETAGFLRMLGIVPKNRDEPIVIGAWEHDFTQGLGTFVISVYNVDHIGIHANLSSFAPPAPLDRWARQMLAGIGHTSVLSETRQRYKILGESLEEFFKNSRNEFATITTEKSQEGGFAVKACNLSLGPHGLSTEWFTMSREDFLKQKKSVITVEYEKSLTIQGLTTPAGLKKIQATRLPRGAHVKLIFAEAGATSADILNAITIRPYIAQGEDGDLLHAVQWSFSADPQSLIDGKLNIRVVNCDEINVHYNIDNIRRIAGLG